jgi:hypothetical protein
MGQRRSERAALRELQRKVWGDRCYDLHLAELARGRQRRISLIAVTVGAYMLIFAVALFAFASSASAHTSEISISCTQVQFNYSQFPETAVVAHESITIDDEQGTQRDFHFTGPTATDVITIDLLAPGAHTVEATTNWSFFGQPQGSADQTQQLSDCAQSSTTSASIPRTSTTIAETTSVPTTTTTTTTSVPLNTTTTTASVPTTTTSVPVTPKGSTTTIRSTTTSTTPKGTTTTIAAPPTGTMPFTGSSTRPLSIALAMLGLGLIASGIANARKRAT